MISEYADNVPDYEVVSILLFSVCIDGDEAGRSFLDDIEAYSEGTWLKNSFANHFAGLFHQG